MFCWEQGGYALRLGRKCAACRREEKNEAKKERRDRWSLEKMKGIRGGGKKSKQRYRVFYTAIETLITHIVLVAATATTTDQITTRVNRRLIGSHVHCDQVTSPIG